MLSSSPTFGSSGVSDPAWRRGHRLDVPVGLEPGPFRAELDVDAGTWSRNRGWALWEAMSSGQLLVELGAEQASSVPSVKAIERLL
jgi:hypothetical protein